MRERTLLYVTEIGFAARHSSSRFYVACQRKRRGDQLGCVCSPDILKSLR